MMWLQTEVTTLVPVHIPGQAARALRADADLAPNRAVGKRTWEQLLADRI